MWLEPSAPPSESKGTAVCKPMMGGRYFVTENTGRVRMPGPDGKLKDLDFTGTAIDGYDNVKKKFVSSWIDNMATAIMTSEGTHDAATDTFTYVSEYEPMPQMQTKVRETIIFEFFEDQGDGENKTMEIDCTRKK